MYQPYTTRKQNLQTSNITHTQLNTIKRTALQQKQIEDLQQKVDIILLHNEQLINQNNELRKIEVMNTGSTARFRAEETQNLFKKMTLQISQRDQQYEQICKELIVTKNVFGEEIQLLNIKIKQLYELNQELKQENVLLLKKIQIMDSQFEQKEQKESQVKKMKEQKQLQVKKLNEQNKEIKQQNKKIREQKKKVQQLNKKTIQQQKQIRKQNKHIQQQNIQIKKQFKEIHEQNKQIFIQHKKLQKQNQQLQKQKKQLIEQKNQIQEKNQQIIKILKYNHQKQITNLKQKIYKQFRKQMIQNEEKVANKSQQERKKAENYIKQMIQIEKQAQKLKEQDSEREIIILRESLQTRKKLIDQLMGAMPQIQSNTWFEELLLLKNRLKDVTQNWMKESQLLKLKVAQKYEIDIGCMSKSYENHIEIMSKHMQTLQEQKDNMRQLYEQQLKNKLKQKHYFELQISKLKNLIRKLKVQLHGIQQQFKLNIDGMKQNNLSFSLSLIKSIDQQKDKAGFYQQQNRKLRKIYQDIQLELERIKIQNQDKCIYYQQKYNQYREKIQLQLQQLRNKQIHFEEQLLLKSKSIRTNQLKQKQHYQSLIIQYKNSLEELLKQKQLLQKRNQKDILNYKKAIKDIKALEQKLLLKQVQIEKLMMQFASDGSHNKNINQTIIHWKVHYERIIKQLQNDKVILKEDNNFQKQQLFQIIRKYKILQNSLQKTLQIMNQKTNLENKIIELGLDNNLIKNKKELFKNIQIDLLL